MNDRRGLTLGVALVLVGVFFLLQRLFAFSGAGPTLLLLGAIFLAVSALRSFHGPLLPGGVLLGLGAAFLLQGPLAPWLPHWATLIAGVGSGLLLVGLLDRVAGRDRRRPWLAPGLILLGIAAGAALARQVNLGAFFESLALLWPWFLLAAGAWLVVTALRRSKT